MFFTLKTMFKWSCYVIYKIYFQYIKKIYGKFISQFAHQRIQKKYTMQQLYQQGPPINSKKNKKKLCF